MNTLNSDIAVQPGIVMTPMRRAVAFRALLKREFWENRGGFLRAPLIAGAVFLLLTVMALTCGEVIGHRAYGQHADGVHQNSGAASPKHVRVNGIEIENGNGNVSLNGLNLDKLTERMSPKQMRELGEVVDGSLYASSFWPFIVVSLVVFFYCLGSLYDDRQDRSVMFWKSLPISDRATVLSKVVSATLIAPAIGAIAAIGTMIGFLIICSFVIMFHGGNPATLLLRAGSPLTVAARILAEIPVYALWALPTVGWLMLCSAWAKSKPILWAILVPVMTGVMASWFGLMQLFNLDNGWFWQHVVARALLSVIPGSQVALSDGAGQMASIGHEPLALSSVMSVGNAYLIFAGADIWIGAAVGIVLIFGAIRLRRWRGDN
jgi:ABC-2 type transport system permease protein